MEFNKEDLNHFCIKLLNVKLQPVLHLFIILQIKSTL